MMLNTKRVLIALGGALLLAGGIGASMAATEGDGGPRGYGGWGGMHHRGERGAARVPLNPEEIDARVREHFARLDRNSDGVIDRAEIEAMLADRRTSRGGEGRAGGIHHRGPRGDGAGGQGAGMMGRVGESRDGKITKDEFLGTIKRRFAEVDLNNDGKITEADLPPMMRGRDILIRPADTGSAGHGGNMGRMGRLIGWLKASDANHDGVITLEEVTAQAEKQFARLDRNGDGVVDQGDRDVVRKEMTEYGVLRFLHRFGADKDGKVTRDQFTKVSKERMARMVTGGEGPMGFDRHRPDHGGMMHGPRRGGWGMERGGPGGQPPGGREPAAPGVDGQRKL